MSARLVPGGFHLGRSRVTSIVIAVLAIAVIIGAVLWIASAASSASPTKSSKVQQVVLVDATTVTQLQTSERVPRVTSYRVVRGDTLSSIGQHLYGSSACWPGIYDQNERVIGGDPGDIQIGQDLVIPASCTSQLPSAPVVHVAVSVTPAPAILDASTTVTATSSFQACVIQAESGGNPDAQNPVSTASGLYGFLDTTWTAVMGIPGPARAYSVAMQNEAFERLYAEAGTSPWGPYDHC
jgi:LysM repeat protein